MELGGMGLGRRAPAQHLGQGLSPTPSSADPRGLELLCWTSRPTVGAAGVWPVGPLLRRCCGDAYQRRPPPSPELVAGPAEPLPRNGSSGAVTVC